MYVIDGIAYAGEPQPVLSVVAVRPLDGYKLLLRFNNNTQRIYDVTPLLSSPAFAPLKDRAVFERVYVDYGCPVWNDGDIDIAPETLYRDSVPAEDGASA